MQQYPVQEETNTVVLSTDAVLAQASSSPTLLQRVGQLGFFCVVFFCIPGKPRFHAAQGMERHADTSRLVRGYSRSTPTIRVVASIEGEGQDGRSFCSGGGTWPVATWSNASRTLEEGRSCCHPLEAVLAALGPEESTAKTEITVALQRAREQDTPQVRFDPEARVAAGRARVARLEQAISALGDMKGPPMDALVVALKRAQQDAQEIPLESQIQAREAFLERANKRIAHFDQERAAELLRIQECEGRLEELRALRNAQQVKPSPPVESSGEVARLQQMVLDLQCQLQQSGPMVSPVVAPNRIRKGEDQEFLEWMALAQGSSLIFVKRQVGM